MRHLIIVRPTIQSTIVRLRDNDLLEDIKKTTISMKSVHAIESSHGNAQDNQESIDKGCTHLEGRIRERGIHVNPMIVSNDKGLTPESRGMRSATHCNKRRNQPIENCFRLSITCFSIP